MSWVYSNITEIISKFHAFTNTPQGTKHKIWTILKFCPQVSAALHQESGTGIKVQFIMFKAH